MFKSKFNGLKFTRWLIIVTATATLTAREAQSGLFDWKPFSRTTAASPKPAAKPKSQSKSKSSQIIQVSDSDEASMPNELAPIAQPAGVVGGYPAYSYDSGYSEAPAMRVKCETQFDCFNCGEDDPRQCICRHSRKKCGHTWYPRIAPYCATDWGYNQPCWRRTQDNYNCPPQTRSRSSFPAPREPAVSEPVPDDNPVPETNPVPEDPPLPRQTSLRR